MAPRNLRPTNRGCPQCRARQCGPSVDCRVARRSRWNVALGLRSALQRASRTNTPGIRNRLAHAEGDSVATPTRQEVDRHSPKSRHESDAAFSKAFKRIVGLTSGEYRRAEAHAEEVA